MMISRSTVPHRTTLSLQKKVLKPVLDPTKNHGRIGAKDYTGCEDVLLSHPTLTIGSSCPDCATLNTKGTLSRDEPQVLVRLVSNPLITGTRYTVTCVKCNV